MFKRNMSLTDRIVRTIFGIVLMLLSWPFLDVVPSFVVSTFCLIFGAINIMSSVVSWCFMYSLIGISTEKDDGHTHS